MKIYLSLFIFFISGMLAFGQLPEPALARVTYTFIHHRDTTQKEPYTENMLLVIGKNASVYTSLEQIDREISYNNPNRTASTAPFKPLTTIDYYSFVKEKTVITRDKILTNYLASEETPPIAWTISKDTLHIEGIVCQKATASFRGRNWIAWFAPDLPFQSGPWKLQGLPGLIVQAYDNKKEVQFLFAGMEKVTASEANNKREDKYAGNIFFGANIVFPSDAKKTTKRELDQLKEAYEKDPKGFISAATGTPKDKIFMGRSATGTVHSTINNPIELIKK